MNKRAPTIRLDPICLRERTKQVSEKGFSRILGE